jgi:ligand-binding sensor domain-containing protein
MTHSGPLARRIVLLAIANALLLTGAPARALDPAKAATQYHLDTWGVKDGLPAHSVTDIEQSRDGYVWLATQGGLVRFDGVRFTVYDSSNVPAMPQPLVWTLSPSHDGSLWAGAYGAGVLRYKDGEVGAFSTGREAAYGFIAVYEDTQARLWAAHSNWGLLRFKGSQIELEMKMTAPRAILDDGHGAIWAGTWGGGLFRIRGDEAETVGALQGFEGGRFVAVLNLGRSGTLWIGGREGLSAYRDGKFKRYTTADGLPDDDVKAVLEDRDGNVWIGTTHGLVRMRDGVISSPLRKANGLADDQALALHEDDEGGIWVGGRACIARLRDTSITMVTAQEGLRADAISQVLPSRNGGVWVATYGGGVAHIDGDRITSYDPKTAKLPNGFVGALYEAADGALWFGVGSNELCRLRDGKVTVHQTAKQYPKAIAEDEHGLLVSMTRAGLHRLSGSDVVPYKTVDGEAIMDTHIHSLQPRRAGGLWMVSNLGLGYLVGGKLVRYPPTAGLPKGDTYSVYEDADGIVWVAHAKGLFRLKDERFAGFPEQKGLHENSVYTVLEDKTGHLWFNSNAGVLSVARADLNAFAEGRSKSVPTKVYGSQQGLKLAEFRGPVVQRGGQTPDGRLWFPSTLGVVTVDPANVKVDSKAPPVILEKVVVDGHPTVARDGLTVPAGTEKVEIHFTGLTYTVPEKATFKYQLEGFDSAWVDAKHTRSAHYTKLPPGRYVFRVVAANSDGFASEKGAALGFEQLPQFHQTWWFRALLGIFVVAGIVGAHRLRVYQLQASERALARKVQETVAHLKTLRGLLPICAKCKKIRDDQGYYVQIETFVKEHSYAEFSHSICPDCLKELYPDYYETTTTSDKPAS